VVYVEVGVVDRQYNGRGRKTHRSRSGSVSTYFQCQSRGEGLSGLYGVVSGGLRRFWCARLKWIVVYRLSGVGGACLEASGRFGGYHAGQKGLK